MIVLFETDSTYMYNYTMTTCEYTFEKLKICMNHISTLPTLAWLGGFLTFSIFITL